MNLKDFKPNAFYLVWSSGDGSYQSKAVKGIKAARKELAAQMYHGPYEEAQQDEMIKSVLEEFDDVEEHWGMDAADWKCDLEQAAIGCMRIDELDLFEPTALIKNCQHRFQCCDCGEVDQRIEYEKIRDSIRNAPMSYLPGIVAEAVEISVDKKCWIKGGLVSMVEKIEKKVQRG